MVIMCFIRISTSMPTTMSQMRSQPHLRSLRARQKPLSVRAIGKTNTYILGTHFVCSHLSSEIRFIKADWNLQFFRFRSRRLQTTEFALDALVYQNYDGETKLKSSPLDYVLAQLEVVLNNWDSLLNASSQFLSSFVRLLFLIAASSLGLTRPSRGLKSWKSASRPIAVSFEIF